MRWDQTILILTQVLRMTCHLFQNIKKTHHKLSSISHHIYAISHQFVVNFSQFSRKRTLYISKNSSLKTHDLFCTIACDREIIRTRKRHAKKYARDLYKMHAIFLLAKSKKAPHHFTQQVEKTITIFWRTMWKKDAVRFWEGDRVCFWITFDLLKLWYWNFQRLCTWSVQTIVEIFVISNLTVLILFHLLN